MSAARLHRDGCLGTDDDLREWVGSRGQVMTTCRRCNWNAATPGRNHRYRAEVVRSRDDRTLLVIRSNARVLATMTPDTAYDLANAVVDALEQAGVR